MMKREREMEGEGESRGGRDIVGDMICGGVKEVRGIMGEEMIYYASM